jgi:Tol biopolymer transport system component
MTGSRASAFIVLAAVGVLLTTAGVAKQAEPGALLRAAIEKEDVTGDLQGAMALYRQVIAANGKDRAVTAKALLRLGGCHGKLGEAQAREARAAYERIVREFADQKEAAEQAGALLAAGRGDKQAEAGIAVQLKRAFAAGRKTQMRHVSPDGRYIPFDASGSVWLHDLATGEERTIIKGKPGSEWGSSAELSPDARQVAYWWAVRKEGLVRHELRVADISGSAVRALMVDQQNPPFPKAWSPDGKRILVLQQNATGGFSHALVSVADGSVQVLPTGDHFSNGCFSPDGKYIVAYRLSVVGDRTVRVPAGLTLIPVDGSAAVPLFVSSAANWAPFWAPDGRTIVFLSDRSGTIDLWSIRMSGGRPQGEPELVKREAGSIDPDPIGFTRDGLFYYKTSANRSDIYSADLDPATGRVTSKPTQLNQRFVGSAAYPMAWSPDGQFLAYARTSRRELGYPVSKAISFIVRSEKTGEEREIAPAPAFSNGYPKTLVWLPDGRSLLADDSAKELFFHQIDVQTAQAKLLPGGTGSAAWYPVMSPDAKALFYVQYGDAVKNVPLTCRLMRRDMDTGEVRELYRAEDVDLDAPSLSADGRQLAFAISDWNHEPNTFSLMIVPVEGGATRERLRSKSFIGALTWTRDGRHVLMMRMSESGTGQPFGPYELWSVPVGGGDAQLSGLSKPGGFAVPADVALRPDGRRIVYQISQGPTEELWVIKNLLSAPTGPRK